MSRLSVVVLFALVAVAFAQVNPGETRSVVDDFLAIVPTNAATLRISTFDTQTVEDFSCDAANGGTQGEIIGGCHVLSLTGSANNGCEPTGSIANGDMFCNNAFNCAATCVLKLDGTEGTSAAVTLGLNVNLNALGTAFVIDAATDIQTTFTIRVHDTDGNISRASGNIPAGSSGSGSFVPFRFDFDGDFTGSANFASVGAIQIVVPNKLDTDVVLTDFDILSSRADISGNVFEDCNCDRTLGGDDTGVGNVPVTLTPASGCSADSQTTNTNDNGAYTFQRLPACQYTVSVPTTGVTSQLCSSSSNQQTVELAGTSIFNVNFGINVPSAFTVPQSAVVPCNAGTSPNQLGFATSATCGGAGGTVSFSDSITNQNCDADYTIIRTWTDGTNSGTQTITVQDTGVPPVWQNADASNLDIDVECGGCTTAGDCIVRLTATDDCSSVQVDFTDSAAIGDCSDDCVLQRILRRTWSAVDNCGNEAARQQQNIEEVGCDGAAPISCPTIVQTFPSVSNVPVTNPPTRNCRFICDDDDSAASAMIASVLFTAILAIAALF
eukprot:TRINITY_DN4362_c0_g1_i1.p2 TRINITY_DN4362_c0_g1~~TRINITY_DN4362_c0_g1_i1.p2  ORF type:complete len:553 (+),score=194.86 TRINITY_DN4362_c0_g1_i1:401-2059(+)